LDEVVGFDDGTLRVNGYEVFVSVYFADNVIKLVFLLAIVTKLSESFGMFDYLREVSYFFCEVVKLFEQCWYVLVEDFSL
jgi:hypothetical protein